MKQALLKSIKHWSTDIVLPLKQGNTIYPLHNKSDYIIRIKWTYTQKHVRCYAEDCPLCAASHLFNCQDCILTKYEKECGSVTSPWQLFYDNPTLETAKNMLAELVHIYRTEYVK